MRKQFDYRNLILVAFSLFIALAIVEVGMRIARATGWNGISNSSQTSQFWMEDWPYWQKWHYPNELNIHTKGCFAAEYTTNNLGIKGPALEEGKPRIVLLGDSFVEGSGCSNDQIVSYYMDSLLNDHYEVLNMGIMGTGTVHAVAQYDNFAKFFSPKVTILFFLSYNDLHDNLKGMRAGFLNEKLEFTYPKVKELKEIETLLNEYHNSKGSEMISIRFFRKAIDVIGDYFWLVNNFDFNLQTRKAEVYAAKENKGLTKGYEIVEKSLLKLKELTEKSHSKLLLVDIATPYQLNEEWLLASEEALGQKLDARKANQRMEKICEQLKIDYLCLYDSTKQYAKEKEIDVTSLSFELECDPHYTAQGNQMMAYFVSNYLKENKYLE